MRNRTIQGRAREIDVPIVGKVVKEYDDSDGVGTRLVAGRTITGQQETTIDAIISTEMYVAVKSRNKHQIPAVYDLHREDLPCLGDIVLIDPSGKVMVLFFANSEHNFLFATNRCNCDCLMCSQPPTKVDDSQFLWDVNNVLINLLPQDLPFLGITGGEPTLLGSSLSELIQVVISSRPKTEIHLLTNGRAFSSAEYVAMFSQSVHKNVTLGIPLYSDYPPRHDYLVQASGAFDQTVLGIYNLASVGAPIEIRIVINRIVVPRLRMLSDFICWYMPFVKHVALMGMEVVGNAVANFEELWVDPKDYLGQLSDSVSVFHNHNIDCSIYNIPLCLLPCELRRLCKSSISEWKRSYTRTCDSCSSRAHCGGLFDSDVIHLKDELHAL